MGLFSGLMALVLRLSRRNFRMLRFSLRSLAGSFFVLLDTINNECRSSVAHSPHMSSGGTVKTSLRQLADIDVSLRMIVWTAVGDKRRG